MISCFSSIVEYQMTLGITKYDSLRQMGQALNAELTSMPDDGELLRQFRIHETQNGWSHSDSNPNFLSAAVGLESTRSRQTLHSISWLYFKASRCLLFFWHILKWSSRSSGRYGCKQCFPQKEHKSPWMWGHLSPWGHLPAAANEHMGRSASLTFAIWAPISSFKEVSSTKLFLQADVLGNVVGAKVTPDPSTDVLEFGSYSLTKETTEGRMIRWESDVTEQGFDDESGGPDILCLETLMWSYLHRLP